MIPLNVHISWLKWEFIIAEVSQSLLDVDILQLYFVLFNLEGKCLLSLKAFESTYTLHHVNLIVLHLNLVSSSNNEYAKILATIPYI